MPNLNAEAHFSSSPLGVDIRRSVFDRSHNVKGTCNAGLLNLIDAIEILPGDDVSMRVSDMIRMTTPLVPVADDCYVDLYAFFEPYRLDWEHWKEFNGENNTSSWVQPISYTVPSIGAFNPNRALGDLGHQMGIPPYQTAPESGQAYDFIHALELRGYRRIWNDWFRDENLQSPKLINTGDTETDSTLFSLLPVNRVHDYFGSCLKDTQKGKAVRIALSGFANIFPTDDSTKNLDTTKSYVSTGGILWKNSSGNNLSSGAYIGTASVQDNGNSGSANGATMSAARPIPSNLILDGKISFDETDFGVDVNTLRLAVQTQRILEKLAIGGSRYTEFVRAMFGVISPDARQQRPELLGHHRHIIRMTEVPQTSPQISGSTPLGNVGAYSKTANSGLFFKKSFTEHGTLFLLYCIRHNRSYSQGIPRQFTRKTFGDFYLPALAHIGEQPVYTYELFVGGGVLDDSIFGFQEAWADLRYMPSRNYGLLDPAFTGAGAIGDIWTYGDVYVPTSTDPYPTLSDSWIQEGDQAIARTLAVAGQDQFIVDFHVDLKHTRCMPVYSVPGLVDHF